MQCPGFTITLAAMQALEVLDMLDLSPWSWAGTAVMVLCALVAVVVVVLIVRFAVSLISRREPWVGELLDSLRGRWRLLLVVIFLWIACSISAPSLKPWWPAVSHAFVIITILCGGWLLSAMVTFGIDRLVRRYDAEGAKLAPHARKMRTQLTLVRRLAHVAIAIIAFGMVIFTFPEMRTVGASLLASAGLVSIIAGLAAQSVLGNLIAGIQLAFSDAIRVGDIVVVEGEFGTVGEITLSYVVVNVWDERRLILPCTYFTTLPFETWTRRSDQIYGTVYFDLDWRVPLDEMRAKFMEIVEASPAWDGRSASLLPTDAVGGVVQVRCLITAANSDDQWSLRCEVREKLITWLQREHPEALPVTRVQLGDARDGSESSLGHGQQAPRGEA